MTMIKSENTREKGDEKNGNNDGTGRGNHKGKKNHKG